MSEKLKSKYFNIIIIIFGLLILINGIVNLVSFILNLNISPEFDELTIGYFGIAWGLPMLLLYLLVHYKFKRIKEEGDIMEKEENEEIIKEVKHKKEVIYWNLDKHDKAKEKLDKGKEDKGDQLIIMNGAKVEILGNLRELRELEKNYV